VTAALACEGLVKTFGAVRALDRVTVSVAAPATGLLGANGAGKSTLMKVALGLLTPDEGEVRVLGLSDRAQIRARVGYMPEHSCLPTDMSAQDLCIHLARCGACPAATRCAAPRRCCSPSGLEEERHRLIDTYSLGMRQRAKLAQALVHGPDLVVLDEPTSGLDPAGRTEMLSILRTCPATWASRCCCPRTCSRTSSAPATRWSCWPADGDRAAGGGGATGQRPGDAAGDRRRCRVRRAAARAGRRRAARRRAGPAAGCRAHGSWRSYGTSPSPRASASPPARRRERARGRRRRSDGMTAAKLYDIRYSRYAGAREARWRSVLALARSSATRGLGLRRTTGAKVWPFLLITAAHLPAIAPIGVPLLFDEAPDPLELMPYTQLLAILTPVIVAFADHDDAVAAHR
jgi:ABC-type Mn2+/Zn2+ transport system ATPase subunit